MKVKSLIAVFFITLLLYVSVFAQASAIGTNGTIPPGAFDIFLPLISNEPIATSTQTSTASPTFTTTSTPLPTATKNAHVAATKTPIVAISTPLPTATATPQPTANPNSGQRYGAVCRDGSISHATGRGACSHHGGVDHWLVYP